MLHAVRRVPRRLYTSPAVAQRRSYLADSFLDLAIALPYPQSWPAYSSTIILFTVLGRLTVLPLSIWANRRMIRYQTKVVPGIKEMQPQIWHDELMKMRSEKRTGDKAEWKKELSKRSQPIVQARLKELTALHKCKRLPTIIVPAVAQLALFLPSSYFLNKLAASPFSPLESESFLSLTSLCQPDESLVLPLVVGCLTLANAEASTWFMSASDREARIAQQQKHRDDAAMGIRTFAPGAAMANALRVVSLVRIGFASQVSGAVVLYWTVSAAFGLVQTWWMEWTRRRAADALPKAASPKVLEAKSSKPPLRGPATRRR